MKEISLSQAQIEDSQAVLNGAVDKAFSKFDMASGYYQPETIAVPRPSFALYKAKLEQLQTQNQLAATSNHGRYTLSPAYASTLKDFAGLRGFAIFAVKTGQGLQRVIGPAIVLEGGRYINVLTAEPPSDHISNMQQAFLESEYAKHKARVSPEHSMADVTNAGEIGSALVVASNLQPALAHGDLHGLATGREQGKTFGTNFSAAGRQDIQIGHALRTVRSVVLPTNQVILSVAEHDQLPETLHLFDVKLTAGEMTVGMTLASTISRHGQAPDLVANLNNMVSA